MAEALLLLEDLLVLVDIGELDVDAEKEETMPVTSCVSRMLVLVMAI